MGQARFIECVEIPRALCRPMEIFLYELWPLLRPGRTYEKISQMPVEVRRQTPG